MSWYLSWLLRLFICNQNSEALKDQIGLILLWSIFKIIKEDFNTDEFWWCSNNYSKKYNKDTIKETDFFTDEEFNSIIKDKDKINMNGRKVLNFSTKYATTYQKFIKEINY